MAEQQASAARVMVYSSNRSVRREVINALGTQLAVELPELEFVEIATEPVVIRQADTRTFDLLILDGEATPAGGLGIARQLKDEIYDCPPIIVLTGRVADAWLATWSRAEAAVPHPLDPGQLAATVGELLRARTGLSNEVALVGTESIA
ncbi:MAG: hypothetical protein ACOYEV_01705 [Candidatus Nanopelagicales bacterium]